MFFQIMKIKDFRGDLADILVEKAALLTLHSATALGFSANDGHRAAWKTQKWSKRMGGYSEDQVVNASRPESRMTVRLVTI